MDKPLESAFYTIDTFSQVFHYPFTASEREFWDTQYNDTQESLEKATITKFTVTINNVDYKLNRENYCRYRAWKALLGAFA